LYPRYFGWSRASILPKSRECIFMAILGFVQRFCNVDTSQHLDKSKKASSNSGKTY
jgi:hypothetical protein